MTQRFTTKARAPKPSKPAPAPANENKFTSSIVDPLENQSIKSIVRKTLLARPDFPRLYADVVISGNDILA